MDKENDFEGLVFECLYVGVQPISINKNDAIENRFLLYFSREPDSAEAPISISEIQAQQLYEDLEKILNKC